MQEEPERPFLSKRRSRQGRYKHNEAFKESAKKGQEAMRQGKPREKKPAEEQMLVDREDPDILADVLNDPVKFLQQELARMIVAESLINRRLYSLEEPGDSALTASVKRLVDLGGAVKGLPNQHANGGKGSQKSLSESVEEALKDKAGREAVAKDTTALAGKMLERADSSFGDA